MLKKIANPQLFKSLTEQLTVEKTKLNDVLSTVKRLKEKKVEKLELEPYLNNMKGIKNAIEKLTAEWQANDPDRLQLHRVDFEELMTRRFFYISSFEIYGGVGGLYDYGPPCCSVKANLLNFWRKHFIIEENMLEVDCTNLTPERVFKASGHIENFTDFMVKDVKTNEGYRADKLIGEFIDGKLKDPNLPLDQLKKLTTVSKALDSYKQKELADTIRELGVKSKAGNDLTDPYPFNLMFSTSIGPTGKFTGYLRPETAQGIFVNFKRLLNYNGGSVPFAAATIGTAFRNEISPRSGLLRVREFCLAEIEHFLNPNDKRHPRFQSVKDLRLTLFPRKQQIEQTGTIEMTLEEALQHGVITSETHGYFVGRTYLFMIEVGLLPNGIRFRQHLKDEMAHYANDCWDCELLTSYGWIECVGIADRSCYDLTKHSEETKEDLTAYEKFSSPIIEETLEFQETKGAIRKEYKENGQMILDHLKNISTEEKLKLQKQLLESDQHQFTIQNPKHHQEQQHQGNSGTASSSFVIRQEHGKFVTVKKKIEGRNYVPSVIEPSFGIGRIIYAILEHAYWVRASSDSGVSVVDSPEGSGKLDRTVLSLSYTICPYKAVVLPLSGEESFSPFVSKIAATLGYYGISYRVDDSGVAVGRRYARNDEIGVPFAITIDFTTVKDQSVTLRERDSCLQVRVPLVDVHMVIKDLIDKKISWNEDVMKKYQEQEQKASEKVGKKIVILQNDK